MKLYKLERTQVINAPIAKAWAFFMDAANLATLTPPYMDMQITSGQLPGTIYPGQIITYRLRPVAGIPVSWATEISHVAEQQFFVDEQRAGPYKIWHHEHHFEELDGKTLMRDIVHYQMPFGILGRLAKWLFVGRQLEAIFNYRKAQIEAIFPVND